MAGSEGGASILEQVEHRPWPLPRRPWVMFMRWADLAFLHWPVPAGMLRPLVPSSLTLDTFEGAAWLGVVPFRMEGTHLRGMPGVPTATTFPEVNVRTYVRGAGRAGVWFLSLDAASGLAVRAARWGLNLPYHQASMGMRVEGREVHYSSRRRGAPDSIGELRARYAAAGPVLRAEPGALEHWLTERYCLFGQRRSGATYFMDVHHLPWPLQRGEAEIERNTLPAASGIRLPEAPRLVHVARELEVRAWAPVRVSGAA